MHLQSQLPRVVPQHEPRQLLVGQHRNPLAFLAIGRPLDFGDGVLPPVEKHGASGTVGHDKVGLVGCHGLELLL